MTALTLAGFLFAIDLPSRRQYTPPPPPADTTSRGSPPPEPGLVLLPRPADAVPLALAELKTIAPYDRCYQRFIWIAAATPDAPRIASLALNYISRASVIRRPVTLANGHLVRVDLRWYAPRDADLHDWEKLWEELGFDPTFNLLVTKDGEHFAQRLAELTPVVIGPPLPPRKETREIDHPGGPYDYPDDSGRRHASLAAGRYTVDLEFTQTPPAIARHPAPPLAVIRCNAPHLPAAALCELQAETHSVAPIVEHRYFLTRAMAAIQDQGVFKDVFGGLYYDFRGIKKSTIKGATDLDVFFEQLGIGNIAGGLKQEQLFESLRSDQRLAVFRSDITGKPREVSSFHTPADREGASWGAITGDVKDADVDIGDRSFANLLNPRRQAREAIFPTRTGLSVFALFNAVGELQDEVPPDVAIDSTIPAPYTRRLQPAIGCIRCHGTDDGWKPLTNDVKRLLAGRFDIFGDLSRKGRAFDFDTIDRLAGLYTGDFSRNLRRARDDVAEATLLACGSFNQAESQADIARVAARKLADEWGDFNYSLIDARAALREAGVDVSRTKAVEVFKQLVNLPTPDPGGVYLEKPTILALSSGLGVLRADFALVQAEIQGRVQAGLARVKP